jgi:hypothetical protein
MHNYAMKRTFAVALFALLFGTVRTPSASPSMVVTCSAPTGLNIASDIEPDQPKGSVPEVYDPEAKAYVSHPRKTESAIITVNKDGTASQTSFSDNGTSLVTDTGLKQRLGESRVDLMAYGRTPWS